MKVNGRKVELMTSEVDYASCPINPGWAASQIARLGLTLAAESKKLGRFTTCPEVLAEAGYEVKVVDDLGDSTEPKSKIAAEQTRSNRRGVKHQSPIATAS